jgi:hypothetical protein
MKIFVRMRGSFADDNFRRKNGEYKVQTINILIFLHNFPSLLLRRAWIVQKLGNKYLVLGPL